MRLDFDSLTIRNFKDIISKTTLDFHALGGGLNFVRGVNLVEPRLGSNGAGKSSLFDALCWALYGHTPAGLRTPDILPWRKVKGDTSVEVALRLDDAPHVLCRHANPNKLLWDGNGATQQQVEQRVGLNLDTFTNTLLLGQGRPLFFDLEPRHKLDLFTTVLNLERWEHRSADAASRADVLEHDLRRITSEIATCEATSTALQASRDRLKQESEEWNATHQQATEHADAKLADYRRQLAPIETKHDEAELSLEAAQTEADHYQRELMQLSAHLVAAQSDLAGMQARAMVKQGRPCPTCGQLVKDAHHELPGKGKLEAARKLVTDLKTQIESAQQHVIDFNKRARAARETKEAVLPQAAQLRAKIQQLQEAKLLAAQDANPFTQELMSLRKRIDKLAGDIEVLTKAKTGKQRKHERMHFWVKGFRDVRLHIIENVLQELELCSNAMLDELGLVGWQIGYDIERETKSGTIQRGLHVFIKSPAVPRPVRWENWSGGESQRLRVLGALALSEVLLNHAGVESGMEVLDEPTQHLSVQGVRDLVDFLNVRARTLQRQVMFIDHRAVDSSRFANVVTVTRDSQGTTVAKNNS